MRSFAGGITLSCTLAVWHEAPPWVDELALEHDREMLADSSPSSVDSKLAA
jgi:hypothetical protein